MGKIFEKMKESPAEIEARMNSREERRQARAVCRLERKEHKLDERMKRKKVISRKRRFFFNKWSFWGIILILVSMVISYYSQQYISCRIIESLMPIITIIVGLLSTIGIALFIGSIFDYSKGSEAFLSMVSNILSDIVVSKKFLSTLSVKDKEQALNLILRPTGAQVEQYANINNYFQKKIKEATTMFDVNFKTNVVFNVEAYMKDGIVYCKSTLTHSIYKLNNQFQPLEIRFEKENSELVDIKVITPDSEVELTKSDPFVENECGTLFTVYRFEIPEKYWGYDHLTVKRTVIEPGHDHWINFFWQSLTPCEGMTCRVDCADGLRIKDFMIFDDKSYYNIDESEDHKTLEITSSQWLNSGTGFSCVIGLENRESTAGCTDALPQEVEPEEPSTDPAEKLDEPAVQNNVE